MGITEETFDINNKKLISFEDIIKKSKEIKSIGFSYDAILKVNENKYIKFLETTIEHPFILDDGELKINKDYFLNNPNKVMELIYFISRSTNESKFSIWDKSLINEEVLKSIKSNEEIVEIFLTSMYEENKDLQFILDKNTYDLFKNTSKVIYTPNIDDDLNTNFDPCIGYFDKKTLISFYKYKDIQNLKENIFISSELSEEELNNFKLIPQGKKISISDSVDIKTIEKILNKIKELELDVEITLNIDNKEIFNNSSIFLTNMYDNLNIKISNGQNLNSLSEYKNYENILYSFLKPLKDKNYSPFEKYIYAYNISKKFKEYKKEESNKATESRNLYEILFNEYMVCVGYANMFSDLLNKLGIENKTIGVDVVTYNNDELSFGGHRRVHVHLKDPKYNIDGYYISDPTWDNDLTNDYYNHAILTSNETLQTKNPLRSFIKSNYINVDELFQVTSIGEFYEKVNYIINLKINNYYKKCKETNEKPDLKEEINNIYLTILDKILKNLENIDIDKFNEINKKYTIPKSNFAIRMIDFNSLFIKLIEDIGHHITNKVNNPVSGESIIDAAMVINKDIFNFTEEQEKEYKDYLIDINIKRQEKAFPKTTIEKKSTDEVIYENEENKFRL